MDRRLGRWLAVVALLASGAVLDACGLTARARTSTIFVTVTREFGTLRVAGTTARAPGGSETVAQLLEHAVPAQVARGGAIKAIDGLSAGKWFYYVNGIGFSVAPDRTTVHGGDHVWFDLHDPSAAGSSPAVVGSFPEPFVHGIGGRGLPTTLGCGKGVSAACARVVATLTAAGVPVSSQLLGAGSGQDSLALQVAPWSQLRGEIVASLIDFGPSDSGVYARFLGASGGSLELLDARGRLARVLGAGAGLIAATRDAHSEPTWMITGTDAAGVMAAAKALSAANLRDRLAVAVTGNGELAPAPAGRAQRP